MTRAMWCSSDKHLECSACHFAVDQDATECSQCHEEFDEPADDIVFEEVAGPQQEEPATPQNIERFECPACGVAVEEEDDECRSCGTEFADGVEEEPARIRAIVGAARAAAQVPATTPRQAIQNQPARVAEENTLTGIVAERYDRQARIKGWDQKEIEGTVLTIVGYNTFSEYLALSASALGIGKICIISTPRDLPGPEAPMLKLSNGQSRTDRLSDMVKKVGNADLEFLIANMTSNAEKYLLNGSSVVVDATDRHESRALVFDYMENESKHRHSEFVHFYEKGFLMLDHRNNLNPLYDKSAAAHDVITAMLAAGLALEEIKKASLNSCEKKEIVSYEFANANNVKEDYSPYNVLLIGAGALGNFVGQGLAALGFNLVDILDFDTIEVTNLNRQLMFYGSVNQPKAKVLAERCAIIRGPDAKYESIIEKFDEKFSLEKYDLVIDCVDNFETREIISKACVGAKVPLASGATSYSAGQAVLYVPGKTGCPNHMLGLEELAKRAREAVAQREREGTGCIVQPDPSVIMSNQVVASLVMNSIRQLFYPQAFGEPFGGQVGYRAEGAQRLGKIEIAPCGD